MEVINKEYVQHVSSQNPEQGIGKDGDIWTNYISNRAWFKDNGNWILLN